MASHGSDTPTSPRAVLHHKDTISCTFMHTTVTPSVSYQVKNTKPKEIFLYHRLQKKGAGHECHVKMEFT